MSLAEHLATSKKESGNTVTKAASRSHLKLQAYTLQFSVHGMNREVITARSACAVLHCEFWHTSWLTERGKKRELRKDGAYSAQPSSAERVLLLLPPSHLACGLPAALPSEPLHAHLHFRSSLQVAEPSPPQTADLSCVRCRLPVSALTAPCVLSFGASRERSH